MLASLSTPSWCPDWYLHGVIQRGQVTNQQFQSALHTVLLRSGDQPLTMQVSALWSPEDM